MWVVFLFAFFKYNLGLFETFRCLRLIIFSQHPKQELNKFLNIYTAGHVALSFRRLFLDS